MARIFLLAKVGAPLDERLRGGLEATLTAHFNQSWRPVGNGNYLVAAATTSMTHDVSNAIGVSDGRFGEFLVTDVGVYHGWADRTLWEWIGVQLAAR